MVDMFISLIMVIISQHMHISKLHIVYHKYIQFLFVNYISIKLAKKILVSFFIDIVKIILKFRWKDKERIANLFWKSKESGKKQSARIQFLFI